MVTVIGLVVFGEGPRVSIVVGVILGLGVDVFVVFFIIKASLWQFPHP